MPPGRLEVRSEVVLVGPDKRSGVWFGIGIRRLLERDVKEQQVKNGQLPRVADDIQQLLERPCVHPSVLLPQQEGQNAAVEHAVSAASALSGRVHVIERQRCVHGQEHARPDVLVVVEAVDQRVRGGSGRLAAQAQPVREPLLQRPVAEQALRLPGPSLRDDAPEQLVAIVSTRHRREEPLDAEEFTSLAGEFCGEFHAVPGDRE